MGILKMWDMKLEDKQMQHDLAGVESVDHENARKAGVFITESWSYWKVSQVCEQQ